MIRLNERKFYVYAWVREDYNTYFYIGKGEGYRFKRMQGRNSHFINIVNKTTCSVLFLHQNLTEEEAFEKEKEVIFNLVNYNGYSLDVKGVKKNKGRHLVNQTWGGEGQSGRIMSDESKKKLSEYRTGTRWTEAQKDKLRLRTGELNWRSIPVVCLNTEKHYPSISQASILTGINASNIHSCCFKRNNYAGVIDDEPCVWVTSDFYEHLTDKEIKELLIHAKKSKEKRTSYNTFYGKKHTDETKEKIRLARLGTKASVETKEKLSSQRKGIGNHMYGKRGALSPIFGSHRTEEEKQKQRQALGTKVRCVELNRIFDSLSYAEQVMLKDYNVKVNRKTIQSRCERKSKKDWYGELKINGVMVRLHWEYV